MCALLCCCYSTNITPSVQNVNQNPVQCVCSNCTKKGLHSLPAALPQPAPQRRCYTCFLIRFLLLATLAPTPHPELLHQVLASGTRGAYGDGISSGQPFLYGLDPHTLTLIGLLPFSRHRISLYCATLPTQVCREDLVRTPGVEPGCYRSEGF